MAAFTMFRFGWDWPFDGEVCGCRFSVSLVVSDIELIDFEKNMKKMDGLCNGWLRLSCFFSRGCW